MNAPLVLAHAARRARTLVALVCAMLLGAALAGHGAAPGHTRATPHVPAPGATRPVTLGASGLLEAAFTGGATMTLTVPTQATNSVGLSGVTMPLTGLAIVTNSNATSPATQSGGGTGRPHASFDLTRFADASTVPLLHALYLGTRLTGMSILVKSPLASGQTAPESLRIDFPKAAIFNTDALSATAAGTEHLTLLPTSYQFTYTPPNNGTPVTFGWDESLNTPTHRTS